MSTAPLLPGSHSGTPPNFDICGGTGISGRAAPAGRLGGGSLSGSAALSSAHAAAATEYLKPPSQQSPPRMLGAGGAGPSAPSSSPIAQSLGAVERAQPGFFASIKDSLTQWKREIRGHHFPTREENYTGRRVWNGVKAFGAFMLAKASAALGAGLALLGAATVVLPLYLIYKAPKGEGLAALKKFYDFAFWGSNKLSEYCGKCSAIALQSEEWGQNIEMFSKVTDRIAGILGGLGAAKGAAGAFLGGSAAAAVGGVAYGLVSLAPYIGGGLLAAGAFMLKLGDACCRGGGGGLNVLSSAAQALAPNSSAPILSSASAPPPSPPPQQRPLGQPQPLHQPQPLKSGGGRPPQPLTAHAVPARASTSPSPLPSGSPPTAMASASGHQPAWPSNPLDARAAAAAAAGGQPTPYVTPMPPPPPLQPNRLSPDDEAFELDSNFRTASAHHRHVAFIEGVMQKIKTDMLRPETEGYMEANLTKMVKLLTDWGMKDTARKFLQDFNNAKKALQLPAAISQKWDTLINRLRQNNRL